MGYKTKINRHGAQIYQVVIYLDTFPGLVQDMNLYPIHPLREIVIHENHKDLDQTNLNSKMIPNRAIGRFPTWKANSNSNDTSKPFISLPRCLIRNSAFLKRCKTPSQEALGLCIYRNIIGRGMTSYVLGLLHSFQ